MLGSAGNGSRGPATLVTESKAGRAVVFWAVVLGARAAVAEGDIFVGLWDGVVTCGDFVCTSCPKSLDPARSTTAEARMKSPAASPTMASRL